MIQENKEYCFCTLALRKKYQLLAKDLIGDIEKYAPGTKIVVYTDNPAFFKDCSNVLAFPFQQEGILHCYHDKRFAIEKTLSMFPVAICIDADARLVRSVPEDMNWTPGITAHCEDIIPHVSKWTPERLDQIKKVAAKEGIALDSAKWIGEALMIFVRDGGKEKEFIKHWGRIGRYLELRGIHGGSGNAIGLAAAKVGWPVFNDERWKTINQIWEHFDASHQKKQRSAGEKFKRRVGYHYRLNKTRLAALTDFNFYYR